MQAPPATRYALLLSSFALAGFPPASMAAIITWDGDTDDTYEDGTNWAGDVAPADDLTTDIARFIGGTIDLATTRQVSGLDFSSGTTLSGIGSIEVGGGGITVSGNSNIDTAGLVLNQATAITLNGDLGISSTLTGTGDLTVTAGTSTIFSMTGTSGNDDTSGYSGNITFDGITATVSRWFMGGGGSGKTLSLLNGATLSASDHLALGNRDIIISGGATINQWGSNNIYRFSGNISGTGGITYGHVGGGNGDRIQLDGTTSTYTGGTTIDNTDLWAANNGGLGEATGDVTLINGGKLRAGFNLDQRDLIVGLGGGELESTGNIDVRNTVTGTGDLTLTGSDFNWYADGNARTGNTVIDGASVFLRNGGTDVLNGSTSTITLDNGGEIVNQNNNPTIGSEIVIGSGGGIIRVGWSNKSLTLNGVVSGVGELTVGNDSSLLRFNNAGNTYSGGTVIQGAVQAQSLGTGTVTLHSANDTRAHLKNMDSVLDLNDLIVSGNGGRIEAGWNKNITFNGVTSGSSALTIESDSGTVDLAGESNTFTGNIEVKGHGSGLVDLRFGSLGSGSYAGIISGNGEIEYAGSGTQILSSANTFSGGTIISNGVLQIGNVASLGTGSITISGGTLDVNGFEVANGFAGDFSGGFRNSGGAVDYSGKTIDMNGGTLTVDGTGDIIIGDINRTGGSPTIVKNGSNTVTVTGATDNVSANLVVNSGTLILAQTSDANIHAASSLTVNGGTAALGGTGNDQIYNGGALTVAGGIFDISTFDERVKILSLSGGDIIGNSGVLTVNAFGRAAGSFDAQSGSVSVILAGNAALTKSTSGVVTLSADNTYDGTTTVDEGTLVIAGDQTGSGQIVLNNAGVLQLGDGTSTAGSVANVGTVFVNNTGTINLFKTDGGSFANLVASNPGAAITLSGTNVAGTTNTFAGTAYSNPDGTGGSLSTFSTNAGATLEFSNANALDIKGTTLTIGGAGDTLFSGAIYNSNGSGSVTKTGSGTATFQAANTYTGDTNVNEGTLLVTGDQSGATGTLTVADGATLSGTGTIGGFADISGTHAVGNSPGLQSTNGNLRYNASSIFEWELFGNTTTGRGTNYDGVDGTVSKALTIVAGATFDIILGGAVDIATNTFWDSNQVWEVFAGFGSDSGVFSLGTVTGAPSGYEATHGFFSLSSSVSDGSYSVHWTAVPEPSSALVGLLIGAGLMRRRRQGC